MDISEGLWNYQLRVITVGIKGVNWLGDKNIAMISIVILSLWTIGNNIIIMLAGIQDIPQSYYESAQIDGAGAIRQIFSITLPLCTPDDLFQSDRNDHCSFPGIPAAIDFD